MRHHDAVPLLLCDLDDTLVDRQSTFRQWAVDLARDRGEDQAFVEWLIGLDNRGYRPRTEFFGAVKERLGLAVALEDLVRDFRRTFAAMYRCEPAVTTVLRDARASGWKIAIITNGSRNQLAKISAAGLDELVDAVCVSEIDGWRKPDVEIFQLGADRCGSTLTGAWMIGDNHEADIGGAHAAGISSVWLSEGRAWTTAAYRPTHIAQSLPAAVQLVLAHNNGALLR